MADTLVLWLAVLVGVPTGVLAENWPHKPVRVIVTAATGSAPDVMARLLADRLGRAFQQQFIVDSRGGAGGNIALGALRRLPADGYALGVVHASAITVAPHTMKEMQYDFDKDFVPVALVARAPLLMVAAAHAPAQTLGGVLALAKAQPDIVTVAVSGFNSVPHLATEMLAHRSGSKFFTVSFNGSTTAISALLSRDAMLMTDGVAALASMVESGKLTPIAVFSRKRLARYPTVPTVAEMVPDMVVDGWFVLVAPRGTPDAIVERLAAEIRKATVDQEVAARMGALGMYPEALSGVALAQFIRSEQDLWRRTADQLGIQRQ
ncbi:Bug family tripartite tricarboxylate transporter substrate binding protein [Vineibacter terrae]|nr:tripartite tricarboxylate transporter substrate binding protein [Vineibacter terrae]